MSQARVQNDYTVAQQIEDKDRAVFLDEKSQAESQNDKAVQYQIARQEATQSRKLYENLVARMKEADVVAGMRSSNITLVDAARVPAKPAKPSVYQVCCRLRLPEDFFLVYAGPSSAMLRTPASRSLAKWSCCSRKLPLACSPIMMQDRNGSAWRRGHPQALSIPPHPS